ncbi:MAG TPA: response regulator [Candidatus Dormibacteraeota bacterium]
MKPDHGVGRRDGQKAKRIVVADDDADVRHILRKLLQPDYDVVVAEDGLVAWDLVRSFNPDVLVTDIQMPRLDGLSLCRKLRENGFQRLRIIVYSGRPVSVQESSGAGADAFVMKSEPLFRLRYLVARFTGVGAAPARSRPGQ